MRRREPRYSMESSRGFVRALYGLHATRREDPKLVRRLSATGCKWPLFSFHLGSLMEVATNALKAFRVCVRWGYVTSIRKGILEYVRTLPRIPRYIYIHLHKYIYIHITSNYIHTFIHAYIRAYMHAYTHTYIHPCMHACMHACMHDIT